MSNLIGYISKAAAKTVILVLKQHAVPRDIYMVILRETAEFCNGPSLLYGEMAPHINEHDFNICLPIEMHFVRYWGTYVRARITRISTYRGTTLSTQEFSRITLYSDKSILITCKRVPQQELHTNITFHFGVVNDTYTREMRDSSGNIIEDELHWIDKDEVGFHCDRQ